MIKIVKFTTLITAVTLIASVGAMAADGDVKKGKKVFKKCKSCHTVGDKAKNKVGPILNNIFGAAAGTNEKFAKKYSKHMIKAGEDGLVWNEATLTEFLTKPKAMIKKTKMSFKGLKKEKDITNIIAYLATFSPDYKPEIMEKEEEAKEETKTDG